VTKHGYGRRHHKRGHRLTRIGTTQPRYRDAGRLCAYISLVPSPFLPLSHSHHFHAPLSCLFNMALLDPNHRTKDPRISQILPTVKCSTCSQPVPLDRLGDHICAFALTSSNPPSDTKPSPPPLTVQTSPSPPNPARSSPMNALFSRRPSTNQRDVHVHDGSRLRNGTSFHSSVPSRDTTPSPAPSRTGVRSQAPTMPPSPSRRAKSPFLPHSSPTREPISRPELIPNAIVPVNSRPGLSSTLDARSSAYRRPSIPSSPLAQPPPPHNFRDPRPAPMPPPHPPIHRPVRTAPSPAPSNHSIQRFASPEVDTKSGGVAGMAGVGRRGFAAVARAAMFATSHMPPVHSPTAPMPAPRVPASSPPRGMSSFISFYIYYLLDARIRCLQWASWRFIIAFSQRGHV
jgi:hypothetical protein